MDMTIDLHGDRLDCGAELADLIEQVADGQDRTEHQQRCRHCQAALSELTLHWAPLRHIATEPVAVPDGLYRAIMRRLHRLASSDGYARWLSEHGSTRVGRWVLEEIGARAARRTPGTAAIRTIEVAMAPAAPATHLPTLAVRAQIVATTSRPLPETAHAIRAAIIDDLRHYAGLHTDRVDIEITELAAPPHNSKHRPRQPRIGR